MFEAVEKFSVVKTLQAIADANVVVLLLDASSEVADQDAHIAGYILESGRAVVMAVNKWDGLDDYQRDRIRREIERKLHFLRWARVHTISALKRTGLSAVMRSVSEAHAAAFAKMPTPRLTRALQEAVARQPPPRAGSFAPQAALCAPGWHEPADHRDPRQLAEPRAGYLPALPRRPVSAPHSSWSARRCASNSARAAIPLSTEGGVGLGPGFALN